MPRVSSAALATILEWLLVGFADIIKLIRDGKRTKEQLESLKAAVQAIIDGKSFKVVIEQVEKTAEVVTNVLEHAGRVLLVSVASFNPQEYSKTRGGLYIWDEFTQRILAVAKPTDVPELQLDYYTLTEHAYDSEMGLTEDDIFEVSEFCAYLAQMIDQQSNGKEGTLLTNGRTNIFQVRGVNGGVFAVNVCWNYLIRKWHVRADRLGGAHSGAGCRVFRKTVVA